MAISLVGVVANNCDTAGNFNAGSFGTDDTGAFINCLEDPRLSHNASSADLIIFL